MSDLSTWHARNNRLERLGRSPLTIPGATPVTTGPVPSIVNTEASAARSVITSAGFVPSGPTSGTVNGQSPTAGTVATFGSTVTYTVGSTQAGARVTAKPDAPQAVKDLNWTTIFLDDFDGTSLDRSVWDSREWYQSSGGFSFDAWYPQPPESNGVLEVKNSQLWLYAKFDSSVPSSVKMKTAEINSRGGVNPSTTPGWFCPANASLWFEARMWTVPAYGTSPQWWTEGDDKSSPSEPNLGWSMRGELDICEKFNIDEGWLGIPHLSLHWPKDYWTNPPEGSRMNDMHVAKGLGPPPLRNPDGSLKLEHSWHTYAMHRTPEFIRGYVDGVQYCEFKPNLSYNGSPLLPPMLFTNRQFLRLGLGIGGSSAPKGVPYQEAQLGVDYVQVWQV